MPTVASVIGGRPHPMKVAPIHHAFADAGRFRHVIIDCGFLDKPYAQGTFADLGLPAPAARIPQPTSDGGDRLHELIAALREQLVALGVEHLLVYGDVEVSVAAAIAAQSLRLPYTHVEAGLRSDDYGDREEIHRITIDHFARYYVTHSHTAVDELVREHVDPEAILLTANPQIESLRRYRAASNLDALTSLGVESDGYVLSTVHRRETLEDPRRLQEIARALAEISLTIPVVLINYRSTRTRLGDACTHPGNRVIFVPTQRYKDYVALVDHARIVVTDSSGLQDETSALGVPCVTCRESTHRFDTVEQGTNQVVGIDRRKIVLWAHEALHCPRAPEQQLPEAWSRPAGADIVRFLSERL